MLWGSWPKIIHYASLNRKWTTKIPPIRNDYYHNNDNCCVYLTPHCCTAKFKFRIVKNEELREATTSPNHVYMCHQGGRLCPYCLELSLHVSRSDNWQLELLLWFYFCFGFSPLRFGCVEHTCQAGHHCKTLSHYTQSHHSLWHKSIASLHTDQSVYESACCTQTTCNRENKLL